MILYLDTGDLLKLYVDEPESDRIAALVRDADLVATSVVAYAEARAALARLRREGRLASQPARSAVRQLDADWPRLLAIALGDELGRAAGRLADRLGVRGFDAIHLASFETLVARSDDPDVRFSSADDRLVRAARTLG